ncbi:phytanoyl-CoA dioxygenase family protein [Oscillatoriales cyanobacterium LEGE 11467]|uniref:Phytanoyl-CoA dioxygenase family protein n=1 Tax=Zarconia navalis LEGE 11467 TaxID=1828826 RepID=A0A928VX85_9CYAN|nr:phytanoyl-CoA dioxygenase family protein [Zarconia navalis]MBE9039470.1 phytanoyl-CoA dioxygenase family protein [Zarconia navalis LEGE 11467]
MFLNEEQLNRYHQQGFLILENQFSSTEVSILRREMTQLCNIDRPERILEKSGAVRTFFSPHQYSQTFQALSHLSRLVEPARQILKSEVYLHQYKLNTKSALDGEQWEWHQDFLYWHKEDKMPEPRALNIVVFLQDVNEFNGPLLVIPGSHNKGTIDLESNCSSWQSTLTADLKYKIDKKILSELLKDSQIVSITGSAGFVLLFHCNLFHASAGNLSPKDRFSAFISYNSVENTLPKIDRPRPEFISSHDFTPIQSCSDRVLKETLSSGFLQKSDTIDRHMLGQI